MKEAHEYGNWYNGQRNVFISEEIHKKLTDVRELYRREERKNITLGAILEGILNNDTVISEMFNEVNK